VVWHLDFLKQVVLAFAQALPVGSNLHLGLQQETPLKSETIFPLTNLTPGSHCSVPSTIPFPQTPAKIGVCVADGLITGGVLEAEIPTEAGIDGLKLGVFEGVEDCDAPVEKEFEIDVAPVGD